MAQQCHPSSLGTSPPPRRSQLEDQSVALGFAFTPTDEQLIVHYLRAYAAGRSLRWDHVVEAEVYSTDPLSLLGDDGEIGYFLTKRTRNGNRVKRTAGRGTWTGQTKKNEIVSARGELLGFKSMFSFCIDDDDDDGCSKKPSKKTTGYVMYEYELLSTANQGRRQGKSQEPVLCCVKKSAREIARSHKRKREEAARTPAAETDTAASVDRDVSKRARHPTRISEARLEYDSSNSISSCIRAAPECATPEFADSSAFSAEPLALAGIPSCQFAADRSSALPMCLSANTVSLFSNSSTDMTVGVDQQQPIPYHGNEFVATDADIFEAGECGYYSTTPEYGDSITLTSGALADVVDSSSTYAADYSTGPLPTMTSDDIFLACCSALGMTADDNLQPIPYLGEWTEMMNAGISYGLGGDIVSSTDCQLPPLPCELIGTTTAAETAGQQLLLAPDQDKQTAVDNAGSLDQLMSVADKAGFFDWYDSLFNDAEPSLPPLVDSEKLFRNCQMSPLASSDGVSAVIEGK